MRSRKYWIWLFCLATGCGAVKTGDGELATTREALSSPPTLSRRYGDPLQQTAKGIAADSSGNILVTGEFAGSFHFGDPTAPLVSAGGLDMYVAKLNPDGSHQWSRSAGDAQNQHGMAVASDAGGNVVVVGKFRGRMRFGALPELQSAGGYDVFVVKLDPSGQPLWSRSYGDPLDQFASAVAIDTGGNIVIVGSFFGSIQFGPDSASTLRSAGSTDVFVAKLDPDGNHVFSYRFGDEATQEAMAVAVDGSPDPTHRDHIVLAGTFARQSGVDFGGGPLAYAGGSDIFLVKLDRSGNHVWSRSFGDPEQQYATGVAIDTAGNVVLTGYFLSTTGVNFGGGRLLSAGNTDIYVAKFDPAANHVWSRRVGDANRQEAYAVATDAVNNVVLTGSFEGTADFGAPVPLHATPGGFNVFIAKLNPQGIGLSARAAGDGSQQTGESVATDSARNVIAAGSFFGTVNFGSGPLTSAGSTDIYVAKFEGGCDGASCPNGCCDGTICRVRSEASCGSGGRACVACAGGQRCSEAGACVCDSIACPNGCCDSSRRCQPSSSATCGTGGRDCAVCGAGQYCGGGACVCDASSCSAPAGCEGTACVVHTCEPECGTWPFCVPCTCAPRCGTWPSCRECACFDLGFTCGTFEIGCYMCPPEDVILPPRGRGAADPPAS